MAVSEGLATMYAEIERLQLVRRRLRSEPPELRPFDAALQLPADQAPSHDPPVAAADDPLATLEAFFGTLGLGGGDPPAVVVPEPLSPASPAESSPGHQMAAVSEAEREAQYDALVHATVQRAWSRAVREYQTGAWINGGRGVRASVEQQQQHLEQHEQHEEQQQQQPASRYAYHRLVATPAPLRGRDGGVDAVGAEAFQRPVHGHATPLTRGPAGRAEEDPHPHQPRLNRLPTGGYGAQARQRREVGRRYQQWE